MLVHLLEELHNLLNKQGENQEIIEFKIQNPQFLEYLARLRFFKQPQKRIITRKTSFIDPATLGQNWKNESGILIQKNRIFCKSRLFAANEADITTLEDMEKVLDVNEVHVVENEREKDLNVKKTHVEEKETEPCKILGKRKCDSNLSTSTLQEKYKEQYLVLNHSEILIVLKALMHSNQSTAGGIEIEENKQAFNSLPFSRKRIKVTKIDKNINPTKIMPYLQSRKESIFPKLVQVAIKELKHALELTLEEKNCIQNAKMKSTQELSVFLTNDNCEKSFEELDLNTYESKIESLISIRLQTAAKCILAKIKSNQPDILISLNQMETNALLDMIHLFGWDSAFKTCRYRNQDHSCFNILLKFLLDKDSSCENWNERWIHFKDTLGKPQSLSWLKSRDTFKLQEKVEKLSILNPNKS